MSYAPTPFIREPTPKNISDYLAEELQAISREMSETTALELRTIHVAPKKPRDGMIVHADGVDWDPGGGAGAYAYQNGAWVGPIADAAAPPDLTPYLAKADNLASVANPGTARGNLAAAGLPQLEFISGILKVPLNQDYRLIEKIPYGAVLVGFAGKLSAGTLTATLKINTTPVTTGVLSGTSVQSSVAPSAAKTLVTNDLLNMTISAVASAVDFSFIVWYTRNLTS